MLVQFEQWAFVLPDGDELEAFKRKHKVDIILLDGYEGGVMGFGEHDSDWRELPEDKERPTSVVRLKEKT